MAQKLLIVDDEAGIVETLRAYFSPRYEVLIARSGEEALRKAGQSPGLILLDINMPGMDGLSVCRTVREHIACPILFLTARDQSADKIDGFRAGADDYIVKPFDLDELAARVEAHLRREQRRSGPAAVKFFGELAVDYAAREVTVSGAPAALSRRGFGILGIDGEGSSDVVMEHIRKLRAKLARHTLHSYIETVWGCGYKWNG